MRSARYNHSTRAQQTDTALAQQTLKTHLEGCLEYLDDDRALVVAPGHLEGCLEFLGGKRALVVDGDGHPIDVRRPDGSALDGADLALLDPRDWIS